MSDLTRRVLEAQKHHGTGAYTTRYTEPTLTCANAAPILARQVEAVEKLADRLEWEAGPDNHGGDEPDYCRLATAARIRDALTEAEKETPNE